MLKIALTGGAGTGKTVVLKAIRKLGVPTMSSDEIVESLERKGSPLSMKIRQSFGDQYVTKGGALKKRAIRRLIFTDQAARRRLERLVHPEVIRIIRKSLAKFSRQRKRAAVVEVPLLFETGLQRIFDITVLVAAPRKVQLKRLKARDWIKSNEALAMIRAQMPLSEKKRLADRVMTNDGTIKELEAKIWNLMSGLTVRGAR